MNRVLVFIEVILTGVFYYTRANSHILLNSVKLTPSARRQYFEQQLQQQQQKHNNKETILDKPIECVDKFKYGFKRPPCTPSKMATKRKTNRGKRWMFAILKCFSSISACARAKACVLCTGNIIVGYRTFKSTYIYYHIVELFKLY